MLKRFICLMSALLLVCLAAGLGEGSSNYLYDSNNNMVPAPPAYIHARTYMASDFEELNNLKSMQAAFERNGKLYVTCSNRLIIFSDEFDVLYTSQSYIGLDGRKTDFDSNVGVFVTEDGEYYICEPNRSRILHFDADNNLLRVLDNPGITGIDASVRYRPTQVAVDKTGRIFVVAKGMYEGIVELNHDGSFQGFYGVNEVQYNIWNLMWRNMATKEQRARMSLWLPTDFTNLCIDSDGFIFATVQSSSAAESVMRLNAKGENILRVDDDDEYPKGDLWLNQMTTTGAPVGASEFAAVDTNEYGVYICLDITRNRVFAYNEDGKLLFIFGGPGNRKGYFRGPVDVDFIGDSIVVLDSTAETIEVFSVTDYGRALMRAVEAQYNYDYAAAEGYWREALSYNQNLFIAYSGIGRAMLRSGDADGALYYLKLGDDRKYYSKALEKVRNEKLKEYLVPVALTLIGALIALKIVKKLVRRSKEKRQTA
ncbi:MAG: hypothetical protein IK019_03545 [Clostridia bacterium]|nr:hypothetical protein [Clostridia bacterium]